MKYSTPELVVLGTAAALVQGTPIGEGDNSNPDFERLKVGLVAGLDD